MALELTIVPAGTGRRARTDIDDIDLDVVTAVKEAYAFCQTSADRLSATFSSEEAANEFLSEARDYAYQADPRLVVEGNTTKKGQARFRVMLYAPSDAG
jgi:hypothetical protein